MCSARLWLSVRLIMVDLDISPAARADLVGIRKYSIEQFSAKVADAYYLGFDEVFALLRSHPLAGQAHPELSKDLRCIVHRKHRIFYTVNGDTAVIIRIIHRARDAQSTLN